MKAVERAGGRTGGGEKGVAGEKGDLGKAEMLKTETLKGRMLRWTPELAVSGGFSVVFICRERSSPDRFAKIHFWRRFLLENRRDARAPFSGVFENQDATVVQLDFLGLPCLSLVEAVKGVSPQGGCPEIRQGRQSLVEGVSPD